MSDENRFDAQSEETSALFVSTQKKKKAEEEAKRKAEEEQARREAAEAEVRRMEQEVEERKRKAEEQRRALEEAERGIQAERERQAETQKQAAAFREAEVQAKKDQIANQVENVGKLIEKGKGLGKSPIFIAAGVALIAIIVVVVILVKRAGRIDYANLECSADYTSSETGFEIPIEYPESLYEAATETAINDKSRVIAFEPAKKGEVLTDVVIATLSSNETGKSISKERISAFEIGELNQKLSEATKTQIEHLVPGAEITDETIAEYNAEDPGIYYYTCSFHSEEYPSGAARAWIKENEVAVFQAVIVLTMQDAKDSANVDTLCDLMAEENSADGFKMPGGYPLENASADGMIEDDIMHMGLHVPADRFYKFNGTTNYTVWHDMNGAMIVVSPNETDADLQLNGDSYSAEKLFELIKPKANEGSESFFTDEVQREFVSDEEVTDGKFAYEAEYKTVHAGVTYWERIHMCYWKDATTGQNYFARIIVLVPEKDADQYRPFVEDMLNNLEDI